MEIKTRRREPLNIWHRQRLFAQGCSRADLDDALRAGQTVRIARGWYAGKEHHAQTAHAIAHGARLTCTSALDLHGVWTLPVAQPHVRLRDDQSIPSALLGAVTHRTPKGAPEPDHRDPIDPLPIAFGAALRCLPPTAITVAADSILNRGLATEDDLERWSRHAPATALAALGRCDRESQSGTETVLRLALRAIGVTTRVQVQIGSDRVDLLIGERLVIECDSLEFHATTEDAYLADHARDLRIRLAGYEVLRFTYAQILFQLDEVVHVIRQHIARDEHRWRPGIRRSLDLARRSAISL